MSWGVVPDGAGCGRARSQPGPVGAARPPGRRDRSSSASRSVRFRTEIGSGAIAVRRRTEDDRAAAKRAGCGPGFHTLGQARLGAPARRGETARFQGSLQGLESGSYPFTTNREPAPDTPHTSARTGAQAPEARRLAAQTQIAHQQAAPSRKFKRRILPEPKMRIRQKHPNTR